MRQDTQQLGWSRRCLTQEVLPVPDAVVIADECGRKQRAWRSGLLAQAQASFVRKAVGLAEVHLPVRKDALADQPPRP